MIDLSVRRNSNDHLLHVADIRQIVKTFDFDNLNISIRPVYLYRMCAVSKLLQQVNYNYMLFRTKIFSESLSL